MKTLDYRKIAHISDDKHVRAVPLFLASGLPLLTEKGGHMAASLELFLLERTGDAIFCAPTPESTLAGIEAIELVLAVREAIRTQCAIDDGLIVLEDEHAKRLVPAILRPRKDYDDDVRHSLAPLVLPAKNVIEGDLRAELARAGANGSAEAHAAEA